MRKYLKYIKRKDRTENRKYKGRCVKHTKWCPEHLDEQRCAMVMNCTGKK
jgi:hypothetical protein